MRSALIGRCSCSTHRPCGPPSNLPHSLHTARDRGHNNVESRQQQRAFPQQQRVFYVPGTTTWVRPRRSSHTTHVGMPPPALPPRRSPTLLQASLWYHTAYVGTGHHIADP
eukprot:3684871-Rhodomonas_salina.1